jgi:hypothetical protein
VYPERNLAGKEEPGAMLLIQILASSYIGFMSSQMHHLTENVLLFVEIAMLEVGFDSTVNVTNIMT